ncbi:MAG: Alpha-amylase, partial [Pseudomonadota bacterium]
MKKSLVILLALLLPAFAGCERKVPVVATPVVDPYVPQPYVHIKHPDWTRSATIYQVNVRQFTPEGTIAKAEEQLPRLKDLGIDIVWLMPLNPIGEKNRKGTLGSPYSVKDYRAVNPEFGTFADVKHFVDRAHALGMHVILDWVANHSAWDNALVQQHPDWYSKDYKGDYHPTSWYDWSDIIDFDYSKPAMRQYMVESMKLWVEQTGIDGFRCDVAGFVPLDFWNTARRELDKVKPVFMLGEWEATDLHADAFDMTYGWSWYEAMKQAAKGNVGSLTAYYSHDDNAWPAEAMRMTFVSNHDKNSWEGTEFEAFGPAVQAAMVLSVVGSGMPLVYNGQEAGNTKRLQFFEKDPIQWKEHPNGDLY